MWKFIKKILKKGNKESSTNNSLSEDLSALDLLFKDEAFFHLKKSDSHLEEKFERLLTPFLVLTYEEFINIEKVQKEFNEHKIIQITFKINEYFGWAPANEINISLTNLSIVASLSGRYKKMEINMKKEDGSMFHINIGEEHMKDEDIYQNIKEFIELAIKDFLDFQDFILLHEDIKQEIKNKIQSSSKITQQFLEDRALNLEINSIKEIMPEELKARIRHKNLSITLKDKNLKIKAQKI